MNLLALDGEVDNRDEVIAQLRSDVRRLAEELRLAKLELAKSKSENESVLIGVRELRSLLSPLYRGLRLTFGEMESLPIPVESSTSNNGSSAATNPKLAIWRKWIEKFGDSFKGKMISTLLEHGPMNTAQLRVPMGCSAQTVINTYNNLRKDGLISKNGGMYSLKEL